MQLLEKVLEESGNNLDAAIKSLQGLRLGYAESIDSNTSFSAEVNAGMEEGTHIYCIGQI